MMINFVWNDSLLGLACKDSITQCRASDSEDRWMDGMLSLTNITDAENSGNNRRFYHTNFLSF